MSCNKDVIRQHLLSLRLKRCIDAVVISADQCIDATQTCLDETPEPLLPDLNAGQQRKMTDLSELVKIYSTSHLSGDTIFKRAKFVKPADAVVRVEDSQSGTEIKNNVAISPSRS